MKEIKEETVEVGQEKPTSSHHIPDLTLPAASGALGNRGDRGSHKALKKESWKNPLAQQGLNQWSQQSSAANNDLGQNAGRLRIQDIRK